MGVLLSLSAISKVNCGSVDLPSVIKMATLGLPSTCSSSKHVFISCRDKTTINCQFWLLENSTTLLAPNE